MRIVLQILFLPLRLIYFLYCRVRLAFRAGSSIIHQVPPRFTLLRLSGWLARLKPPEAPHLFDYLALLDLLRRSKQVKRALLLIPAMEAPWNEVLNIADAIGRLQRAGVSAVAYLEGGNLKSLVLAAACQERWSSPESHYLTPLPNIDSYFLGDALRRLGVRIQTIAAGRHKDSGYQPFQRSDYTAAARKEMQTLVGSLREQLRLRLEQLPSGPALWRLLGSQVENSAQELHEIGFFARLEERIAAEESWLSPGLSPAAPAVLHAIRGPGENKPPLPADSETTAANANAWAERQRKLQRARRDLSSEPSILKRYQRRKFRPLRFRRLPIAGIVAMQGPIVSGRPGDEPHAGTVSAAAYREVLRDAASGPAEAIFLYIDSPGGSAEASEVLYQELRRLSREKPTFAVLGSVAASGGYYLACAANRIYASSMTLTGSIGVIRIRPELGRLYHKLGVRRRSLLQDPTRDLLAEVGELSPAAKRLSHRRMAETYELFLRRVAEGRGISRQQALHCAEGRIFTGADFEQVAMLDGLAGLLECLRIYGAEAGYQPEQEFEAILYPEIRADWRSLAPVRIPFGGSSLPHPVAQVALRAEQLCLALGAELRQNLLLAARAAWFET
ncbi:MAG: S49 family peptidase [Leptospirales bacterium]|nr:S49 family peptidase [Leptospirales bacterium]